MTKRLMKTFNPNVKYPNIKIESATCNVENFSSVYIIVEGWFDEDLETIHKLRKQIRQTISNNLNLNLFTNRMILDTPDIPLKKTSNECYATFEYTIFLKKVNIIEPLSMRVHMKKLTDIIFEKHFMNTNLNHYLKLKK